MIATRFGDMARQHMLSQNMRRLKTDMTALTQEMSSGQVRDPARTVGGEMMRLASLDRLIGESTARLGVLSVVTTRLDAQHLAIQTAEEQVLQVADLALRQDLFGTDDRLSPIADHIGQAFAAVVGVLNTQAGGRSLFAGVAADRPALASAQTMLTDLAALIPAGADGLMVAQIVDDWFAVGGGFDSSGYLGGSPDTALQDLGDGQRLGLGVTAADASVRASLAALAKGALMAEHLTNVTTQTRRSVLNAVASDSRTSAAGLRLVIEDIGIAQARAEQATVRQQSAQVAANMARTTLIGADPYDTATALQDTIARTEQLFAITARLSRLSLSAYL
jgi:flagellar hook-associated protein 3 FlgL